MSTVTIVVPDNFDAQAFEKQHGRHFSVIFTYGNNNHAVEMEPMRRHLDIDERRLNGMRMADIVNNIGRLYFEVRPPAHGETDESEVYAPVGICAQLATRYKELNYIFVHEYMRTSGITVIEALVIGALDSGESLDWLFNSELTVTEFFEELLPSLKKMPKEAEEVSIYSEVPRRAAANLSDRFAQFIQRPEHTGPMPWHGRYRPAAMMIAAALLPKDKTIANYLAMPVNTFVTYAGY